MKRSPQTRTRPVVAALAEDAQRCPDAAVGVVGSHAIAAEAKPINQRPCKDRLADATFFAGDQRDAFLQGGIAGFDAGLGLFNRCHRVAFKLRD